MLLRESLIHHHTPIKFIHCLFPANLRNYLLKTEIIPLNFGTVQVVANGHYNIVDKETNKFNLVPNFLYKSSWDFSRKKNVIQFSPVGR